MGIAILRRDYGGYTVEFEGRVASIGFRDTSGDALLAAAEVEDRRLAERAFRNRRLHALAVEVLRCEAEALDEKRKATRAKRALSALARRERNA